MHANHTIQWMFDRLQERKEGDVTNWVNDIIYGAFSRSIPGASGIMYELFESATYDLIENMYHQEGWTFSDDTRDIAKRHEDNPWWQDDNTYLIPEDKVGALVQWCYDHDVKIEDPVGTDNYIDGFRYGLMELVGSSVEGEIIDWLNNNKGFTFVDVTVSNLVVKTVRLCLDNEEYDEALELADEYAEPGAIHPLLAAMEVDFRAYSPDEDHPEAVDTEQIGAEFPEVHRVVIPGTPFDETDGHYEGPETKDEA